MKRLLCRNEVTKSPKPYIAMLLIQFAYAGMALFSKAAVAKGMNAFVFVVYRQAFATLTLAPFAFFLESQKTTPLSYYLLFKIFLVSLFGLSLSLNLYYVAINHTTVVCVSSPLSRFSLFPTVSNRCGKIFGVVFAFVVFGNTVKFPTTTATFAAATTNTIPTITFVLAGFLRMERISVTELHGIAKILGSVASVSGALVFAFVKGPPLKFMHWYPEIQKRIPDPSSTSKSYSTGEWVKGALIMILANTAWSLWLVLQGPIVKQYSAKIRLTTLQCFFSCIQSAFVAVAVERNPSAWKLGWDIRLLSVTYCGVVINGITYWLLVWAIEKKGPVFTAIFTPFALIITAIFSLFLWKETLYWGSVGGAILLVGGLYSVLWGKNKEVIDISIRGNNNDEENPDQTKEEITAGSTTNH